MFSFKKVCKDPSSLTLIEMLGLNITLTEKLSKMQNIFAQIILYNGKLNENYLLTRVRLYENLKPKSSIPLSPDLHFLAEKLKRVHLRCYVWLNAIKATLPLLNIDINRMWKGIATEYHVA